MTIFDFKAERTAIFEAVSAAARAVDSRNFGSLSGIRLVVDEDTDKITVTGTDLDTTIVVEVMGAVAQAGEAILPASLLTNVLRQLDKGAVRFTGTTEEVTITSGRSRFNLRGLPPGEYARITHAEGKAVETDALALARSLNKVAIAAASDDTMIPVIGGILVAPDESDGLRLAATDRYRLAVLDMDRLGALAKDHQGSLIVPRSATIELLRFIDESMKASVTVGKRMVTFRLWNEGPNTMTVTAKLIEGEFPAYAPLLNQEKPNQFTTPREPLIDALKRVKIMARDPSTPVAFDFRGDDYELRCETREVGWSVEKIDGVYDGRPLRIGFNPSFLIDGLNVLSSDEVVLEVNNEMQASCVRALDDTGYRYIIMPVKLTG